MISLPAADSVPSPVMNCGHRSLRQQSALLAPPAPLADEDCLRPEKLGSLPRRIANRVTCFLSLRTSTHRFPWLPLLLVALLPRLIAAEPKSPRAEEERRGKASAGAAASANAVPEQTSRGVRAAAGGGGADSDSGRAAPPGKLFTYKSAGGEPQNLEVYFPPNHNPAIARVPALLLFHGGGWSRGSLTQFRVACEYFARRGLVAATADYRMHKKEDVSKLPQGVSYKRICVTDAKSAIRWMKQHAAELGLDPRRLITGGGSAGGHIAVLASANRRGLDDPADPAGFDPTVMAHVLFNPAFTAKDSDAEINVLSHLSLGFPPSIAFFGSEDRWKPAWDEAQRKLRALGHAHIVQCVAPGQIHGFYLKAPWEDATLIAADRFLAQLGFLQGEPTLAAVAADGASLQIDAGEDPRGRASGVKPTTTPR